MKSSNLNLYRYKGPIEVYQHYTKEDFEAEKLDITNIVYHYNNYNGDVFIVKRYIQDYEAETLAINAAMAARNIENQFKKDISYDVVLVSIDRTKLELVKDWCE